MLIAETYRIIVYLYKESIKPAARPVYYTVLTIATLILIPVFFIFWVPYCLIFSLTKNGRPNK